MSAPHTAQSFVRAALAAEREQWTGPSAQHTPAPWWPTESGVRDRGGYIAHTHSVQRYEGQDERYALEVAQREADKLLIAAAPDLLKQLQHVVRFFDQINPADVERYRAAIAKATGSAS